MRLYWRNSWAVSLGSVFSAFVFSEPVSFTPPPIVSDGTGSMFEVVNAPFAKANDVRRVLLERKVLLEFITRDNRSDCLVVANTARPLIC